MVRILFVCHGSRLPAECGIAALATFWRLAIDGD